MTDEAALLAAILAHPDEDTPRLMYADWLQEHGQEDRAEFIRVSCELARLEYIAGESISTDHELSEHEADLATAAFADFCPGCLLKLLHAERFIGPPLISLVQVTIRRGFISVMSCTGELWVRLGDHLLACEWIPRVRLTAWPVWEYGWEDGYGRLVGREREYSLRGWERRGDVVPLLLKAEWPRVVFEMPPKEA